MPIIGLFADKVLVALLHKREPEPAFETVGKASTFINKLELDVGHAPLLIVQVNV